MAQARDVVFLVPGFFGFTEIGTLSYFVGVRSLLRRALHERGIDADIHTVATQPTGSLSRRAVRLLEQVADTTVGRDQALHFVGHSTGGLDARLLVSPGVRIAPDSDIEELIGMRTRTVTTVSTPHYGTPLANFFTTAFGRQILYALSALATTRARRSAVAVAAQLTALTATLAETFGRNLERFSYLGDRVFSRISGAEEDALWAFLREVRADQGALLQLTAESTDLLNAAIIDRPGVAYSCLCTASPPPRPVKASLARPLDVGLYRIIWNVTSHPHRAYEYPHPGDDFLEKWSPKFDFALDDHANDGIVPTLSQVYGEVLDVMLGDHLDIVGQYRRELEGARHVSWLNSGSAFDDVRFKAAWEHVAAAIAANCADVSRERAEPKRPPVARLHGG